MDNFLFVISIKYNLLRFFCKFSSPSDTLRLCQGEWRSKLWGRGRRRNRGEGVWMGIWEGGGMEGNR